MHACPNDCMLFYKNTENVNACNYCQSSRYIHRDNKKLKKTRKGTKIPSYHSHIAKVILER